MNFDWNGVSTRENSTLIVPFPELEIMEAIKMLGKNKAPDLDGFTAEFLLKFWDI